MSVAAPTMCARRFYTTESPLPTPGSAANADPKIAAIVDQIEGLTLLQTSELVAQLKVLYQL
jgi:large subunit ribosomal protein L7/L12